MSIPYESESEIAAIGEGLLARTLPKPGWTHAAHFAAALWLIKCRPDLPARAHMPRIIRTYNEATGVANTETSGYHETITQASLRAAHATLARHSSATPVYRIANDLMTSALGHSNWLLAYWSSERLFSPEARARWCDPDLQAFPF